MFNSLIVYQNCLPSLLGILEMIGIRTHARARCGYCSMRESWAILWNSVRAPSSQTLTVVILNKITSSCMVCLFKQPRLGSAAVSLRGNGKGKVSKSKTAKFTPEEGSEMLMLADPSSLYELALKELLGFSFIQLGTQSSLLPTIDAQVTRKASRNFTNPWKMAP